jgi:hypothetical protein
VRADHTVDASARLQQRTWGHRGTCRACCGCASRRKMAAEARRERPRRWKGRGHRRGRQRGGQTVEWPIQERPRRWGRSRRGGRFPPPGRAGGAVRGGNGTGVSPSTRHRTAALQDAGDVRVGVHRVGVHRVGMHRVGVHREHGPSQLPHGTLHHSRMIRNTSKVYGRDRISIPQLWLPLLAS